MEMQQGTGTGASRAEVQRACQVIRQRIITLELAPGAPINESQLAAELEVSLTAVRGALKLLVHEHLVVITPRYGAYVAPLDVPDLDQLSELRVELESLAAGLAAQRATPGDLAALDAIRQKQLAAPELQRYLAGPTDLRRLFDIDHEFHRAIAAAARNRHLAQALEAFFSLSLRLWYLALRPRDGAARPSLDSLDEAVEKHLDLVAAIRRGHVTEAEGIMRAHVSGFYTDVRAILDPSAQPLVGQFPGPLGPQAAPPARSAEPGRAGIASGISSMSEDVEVRRAYAQVRERIVTLNLPPGAAIKPDRLAGELELSPAAVEEALELLAHDGLVVITPPQEHGIYVSSMHLADLDELSETRLRLESLSARLAAQRATADDLAVLDALTAAHRNYSSTSYRNDAGTLQEAVSIEGSRHLLDLDHKLHQAIARAAANKYLAGALDHFFGLSQRLWYLALPRLAAEQALPSAVRKHADLVDAIRLREADRAAAIMHEHVAEFTARVRLLLAARVTVSYGNDVRSVIVEQGGLLSGAVIATGLPLEQPCAGRGTCLKCKVIAEGDLSPLDDHEITGLTQAERASHYRLACRVRILGDASVTLAPILVYSNKIFRACNDHRRRGVPLGLAIDLGSTTVAAFVTTLDAGKVCAGAAALNQQTAFGADVISRLAAAQLGPETAQRVSTLALSSIVQAVDALKLAPSVRERIRKVTIVGNCAMHHLLLGYPVDTLAELPFQPYTTAPVRFRGESVAGQFIGPSPNPFADIFPVQAEVALPPLIGGFVGSDALACLLYYGFDRAPGPMAAIDLGTNGEVMVTDGARILTGSTAAGPAFEGVNISCGTRAVDGAIVGVRAHPDGSVSLKTVGNQPPVGLTGSGLLELVNELRRAGVIDATGRLATAHPVFGPRLSQDEEGVRRFLITDAGVDRRGLEEGEEGARVSIYLTQHDIRELQKAKGAIRATIDTLLDRLELQPGDLQRMILTGSFGSQLDVKAVAALGMIPPVPPAAIEPSANGAGLGAALMLDETEFARAERLAAAAVQVDLDMDPGFDRRYVRSLALTPKDEG